MTTTIPSGLGSTFGMSTKESSYGNEPTVTRWFLPDASDGFTIKKNIAQSNALNSTRFHVSKRRVLVTKEATGKLVMDACDLGMGLLFQGVLGSAATAVQQGGTTAYLQQHVPGAKLVGFSYNIQKGIPETPSGTVDAYSYPGSKIVDLTISCKVNEIAKIEATFDCQQEDTSAGYAAPALPSPNVFSFNQATVLLGGTPTTNSGICTISGGAAPAGIISSFDVKITNKLNTARFNAGASTKNEPVESDFTDVTGTFEIEYANQSDFYTAMAADTQTSVQFNFLGALIQSPNFASLNIMCPAIKFNDATPMATSTDVVKVSVPFNALTDGTDPTIQISYQTTGTTV